jgi:hypothetical protein
MSCMKGNKHYGKYGSIEDKTKEMFEVFVMATWSIEDKNINYWYVDFGDTTHVIKYVKQY